MADNISIVSKINSYEISDPNQSAFDILLSQYERVVVDSLITSFGLDLFITDRHGGDVDTIHNVREVGRDPNMTYKNKANETTYAERGSFDRAHYDGNPGFAAKKREARAQYNEYGTKIKDAYTGRDLEYTKASAVPPELRVELDHVVECKGIHDDRGRVLAGLTGPELANTEENWAWTNKSLNASMGSWARHKNDRWRKEHGCDAPLSEVDMVAYLTEEHPELDAETRERMLAQYEKSRGAYESRVCRTYYTSTKFLKDSLKAAGKLSLKMGTRQAIGLVFSEIWFAIKDEWSQIINDSQGFWRAIGHGFKTGLSNAKQKYKEIWNKFIEGSVSGALSAVTTTICNIFFSTAKSLVKIIRNAWASLVQSLKILLFNPDCLPFGERIRAAAKILATGASVVVGILVGEAVSKSCIGTIPVMGEIVSTFVGTFLSGLVSCSLLYFLDHNSIIQKIVELLNKIPTLDNLVTYFRQQAALLEEYCAKLYSIDLDKFKTEIASYTKACDTLLEAKTQTQLSVALRQVYETCGLHSPYEGYKSFDEFMDDPNSSLIFR